MERCAVIDAGYLVYRAGFVGEESVVHITHPSGFEGTYKNITEFFGRGKTLGSVSKVNAERAKDGLKPILREECIIEDIQRIKEPIENVLHSLKMMIEGAIKGCEATDYKMFIDIGESWRVERSTLLKYKGNRDNTLRPLYKDQIMDYLVDRWKATGIFGIESDDLVTIEAYGKEDHVVVSVDKDALGQPTLVYNPDKPDVGVLDCNSFGRLWVNPKGDVKGYGRKWLYYQMLNGDATDNYKPSCFSGKKYGGKAVYKALLPAINDAQAFRIVYNELLKLYPKMITVEGWRGDNIQIDAMYVANEMFDMARMLRRLDDKVIFKDAYEKIVHD